MGIGLRELEDKRRRVHDQLAGIGDIRQGTLTERYRKCGKQNCKCAEDKAAGHGPSFSLTKTVKGKTVTRVIPKQAVDTTKSQIEQFKKFRQLSQEFVAVNEEICDAKLTEPGVKVDEAQKKTSRRCSRTKSLEKSKN